MGRFRRPLKKLSAREKKKKKVSGEGQKQSIASEGKKKAIMSETIKIMDIFRHSGRYFDISGHIRNKSRQKEKKKKIKSGRFGPNRLEFRTVFPKPSRNSFSDFTYWTV
jgi:hypothetical protein